MMFLVRICLMIGLFSCLGTSVLAQAARDEDNPTCPPRTEMNFASWDAMSFRLELYAGQRILIADGGVDAAAAFNLDSAIRANQPIDEIWVRSPGGVASQGPALGLVIRSWGIPTRVPNGWWCVSACNFMFLGGPIRTIDPNGVYAVHMFTVVNNDEYESRIQSRREQGNVYNMLYEIARREQSSAQTASAQNDFLIRMGVSRRLLTEVMYLQKADNFTEADRSTIRCLTREEMTRYNVVNSG